MHPVPSQPISNSCRAVKAPVAAKPKTRPRGKAKAKVEPAGDEEDELAEPEEGQPPQPKRRRLRKLQDS